MFVCIMDGEFATSWTHIVSVATKHKLDPLFGLLVLQQSDCVRSASAVTL